MIRWGGIFDVDSKKEILNNLEIESSSPDFWTNPKEAEQTLKKIQSLKKQLSELLNLNNKYDDVIVLSEFLLNKEVTELEINESFNELLDAVEDMEFKMMLSKKEDKMSAILQITAGAGGTESCDWAEMLMRMYLMWG